MQTLNKFGLGEYVVSKAGRDKGRLFIIIGIIDDIYVSIVDGDLRRVEKPKKKKVKHLVSMNKISREISDKLSDNKKITNLSIRREIEKLNKF